MPAAGCRDRRTGSYLLSAFSTSLRIRCVTQFDRVLPSFSASFLAAAAALGVEPAACVVVEDAAPGVAAAHAAGMQCVALVSTGRTAEELKAADLIVHSLNDLTPERIRQLIDGDLSRSRV